MTKKGHNTLGAGCAWSCRYLTPQGSLRLLFEAPDVMKILYDVRSDTDALYHNHKVKVANAFDLQVLRSAGLPLPEFVTPRISK